MQFSPCAGFVQRICHEVKLLFHFSFVACQSLVSSLQGEWIIDPSVIIFR